MFVPACWVGGGVQLRVTVDEDGLELHTDGVSWGQPLEVQRSPDEEGGAEPEGHPVGQERPAVLLHHPPQVACGREPASRILFREGGHPLGGGGSLASLGGSLGSFGGHAGYSGVTRVIRGHAGHSALFNASIPELLLFFISRVNPEQGGPFRTLLCSELPLTDRPWA